MDDYRVTTFSTEFVSSGNKEDDYILAQNALIQDTGAGDFKDGWYLLHFIDSDSDGPHILRIDEIKNVDEE